MLHGRSVTIVAAMGRNRAIGLEGKLPWHLPRELQHFKATTMGKPIVMGRVTWESIGRALPGRQNIVVTRDRAYAAAGCVMAHSLEEAIGRAAGGEVMIIGGGQLYREALPFADRLILTVVDCEPAADTWFPDWKEFSWRQDAVRSERADDRNPCAYEVIELTRQPAADETARAPGTPGGPPA